jgi:alpha-beta hydrolase superfamily lysophospholipase
MIKIDLHIDIDREAARGEHLQTAVTVIAPEPAAIRKRPIVFFGWPGGGYNRHYYDLQLPARSGYSQAEYHAANGFIFVACDHIGVGDSSIPEGAFDHPVIAGINAATARQIIERLREGTLDSRLPALPDLLALGMGQSYGGLLLTHLQANHALFDGVAMLGWSGICTQVRDNSGNVLLPDAMAAADGITNGLEHPYRRSFHFDDVPEDIVAEDLLGYPARIGVAAPAWAAIHMPGGPNFAPERGPTGPDVVVEEAAAITVPVFIGNGEIDTVPDPRAEPLAYRSSSDITTVVIPRASHMHNFAGTREILWRRLEGWALAIANA